jgi:hypothetical protein
MTARLLARSRGCGDCAGAPCNCRMSHQAKNAPLSAERPDVCFVCTASRVGVRAKYLSHQRGRVAACTVGARCSSSGRRLTDNCCQVHPRLEMNKVHDWALPQGPRQAWGGVPGSRPRRPPVSARTTATVPKRRVVVDDEPGGRHLIDDLRTGEGCVVSDAPAASTGLLS